MAANRKRSLLVLALALVLAAALPAAGVSAGRRDVRNTTSGVAQAAGVSDLRILSYQLDPRLTKGLFLGTRWVSPPDYDTIQSRGTFTLIPMAEGLDPTGDLTVIPADWVPI